MRDHAPECLRCKRQMEPGFLLDREGAGPSLRSWVPGVPETSFWTGLKLKGKAVLPVSSFRCPQCGCVDSFAWPA